MKKIISLLLLVLICLSLSNCGSNTNEVIETTDTIEETVAETKKREIINLTLDNYEKYIDVSAYIDLQDYNLNNKCYYSADVGATAKSKSTKYIFNNVKITFEFYLYRDSNYKKDSLKVDDYTAIMYFDYIGEVSGKLYALSGGLTKDDWNKRATYTITGISGTLEELD